MAEEVKPITDEELARWERDLLAAEASNPKETIARGDMLRIITEVRSFRRLTKAILDGVDSGGLGQLLAERRAARG